MTKVAERIKAYRSECGMSQEAFAKTAGVSRSCITHIELGHRQGSKVDTLVRIARVLGCELGELINLNVKAAS